jgi:hypothetical protein
MSEKTLAGSTPATESNTRFKQMDLSKKCAHIGKLVIFLMTFGFAYPHIMDIFM